MGNSVFICSFDPIPAVDSIQINLIILLCWRKANYIQWLQCLGSVRRHADAVNVPCHEQFQDLRHQGVGAIPINNQESSFAINWNLVQQKFNVLQKCLVVKIPFISKNNFTPLRASEVAG